MKPKVLDVVALTKDLPERGLYRGQVGTVVESLAPGVFEVEFCDNDGRTYATLALRAAELMVLHYQLVKPVAVADFKKNRGRTRRRDTATTGKVTYRPTTGSATPVRESKHTPRQARS